MLCLPSCPPRRLVQIDLIICGRRRRRRLLHLELFLGDRRDRDRPLSLSFSAPPQNEIDPQVEIQQRRKGKDPGQDQAAVLKDGGEDRFIAKLCESNPVKGKVT